MEESQWLIEILEKLDIVYSLASFVTTYAVPISVGVVLYICQSVGLSTVACRRGIQNSWLAWLPLGNLWILGSISDHYRQVTVEQEKNKRGTLLLLGLLCLAAVAAFAIGLWGLASGTLEARFSDTAPMAVAMVFIALLLLAASCWLLLRINAYIAMYDLLRSCEPRKAVVYLLLCIVVYAAQPLIVFVLRKKDNGVSIRRAPEVYYQQSRCEF